MMVVFNEDSSKEVLEVTRVARGRLVTTCFLLVDGQTIVDTLKAHRRLKGLRQKKTPTQKKGAVPKTTKINLQFEPL